MDTTSVFDNESIWVFEQLMETLYTVTPDGKNVKPWLATSYDLSTDKLTYTFHLRKGVKFHNGQEMTAADVKFSIDAGAQDQGRLGLHQLRDQERDAPRTSTRSSIKTKYPWAPLVADLALFSNAIIPKNYGGKTKKEFYDAPVGTGPFKWDHWTKGKELKLTKLDKYWQKGKPYLDSVTWTNVARRQHAHPAAQGRPGADRRVPRLVQVKPLRRRRASR